MAAVITATGLTKYFFREAMRTNRFPCVPRGSVTAYSAATSPQVNDRSPACWVVGSTRRSSTILGPDSRNIPPALRHESAYLAGESSVSAGDREPCSQISGGFFRAGTSGFDATVDHFGLKRDAKGASLRAGKRPGLALAPRWRRNRRAGDSHDPRLGARPGARGELAGVICTSRASPSAPSCGGSHMLDESSWWPDYLLILDRSCCGPRARGRIR